MAPLILVVDDHVPLLKALRRSLESWGCIVIATERAEYALKILASGFEPVLILSDMDMPGMQGDEFCRLVKAQYPKITFVLTSGSADVIVKGRAVGADYTFLKPVANTELRALIRMWDPT